jgi:valyl-tRNA synthetase
VTPGKKVDVTIGAGIDTAWLQAEEAMIKHLARVRQLAIVETVPKIAQAASAVVGTIQVSVSLAGLIDIEKEKLRMKKQIDEVRGYKNTLQGKLENKQFVSHAPKAVVATEKEKLEAAEEKLQKLEAQLAELG